MKDLHDLLSAWQPPPSQSPGFQREVWSRIAATNHQAKSTLPTWLDSLLAPLLRPQVALASALAAAVLGIAVGGLFSLQNDSERENYLASVNPYAMARSEP